MIGKLLNKETIALIFVSMLTVLAVVYGFSTIPNPAQQRAIKLDHQRVSDLGKLKQGIETYYYDKNLLPTSLKDVETNKYSYYDALNTLDPETGQSYEYLVTNPTDYQLCATFTTDSTKEADNEYDSENYNYSMYKKDFEHPIGRKCFSFSVQPTYQYPQTTKPLINTIRDLPLQSSSAAQ